MKQHKKYFGTTEMESSMTRPSKRELEMLACLEATLKKLAQAKDYIQFLGGCNESIADIDTHLDVSPYLLQYDIIVPIFTYQAKELTGKEERIFWAELDNDPTSESYTRSTE